MNDQCFRKSVEWNKIHKKYIKFHRRRLFKKQPSLDERGQIWAEQSGATKYFRRPAVCMMKLFVILTPPFLTFLWYKNFQLAWPKWYQSIRLGTSSEIENHFQDNRTNGVEVTNVFSKFLPKFPNFHRVRQFLRKFTEKTATAGELKFSGAIELGEI